MKDCYGDVEHGATVDLIRIDSGRWLVSRVAVSPVLGHRSGGHASRLMRRVCAEADRAGVTLLLDVSPDAGSPLDADALRAWYRRLGFISRVPNQDVMDRMPLRLWFLLGTCTLRGVGAMQGLKGA